MIKFSNWDYCKKSAFVSSWDDYLTDSWRKLVEYANKKQILLTFYINNGYVEDPIYFPYYQTKVSNNDIKFFNDVFEQGHEIGGHTTHHNDMSKMTNDDIEKDCLKWLNAMKTHTIIKEQDVENLTFAYPYGKRPKSLDIIKKHFIGARSITNGLNDINPRNIYRLKSIHLGKRTTLEKLNKLLDESIENNKLLIESGHGVDKEGYSPIPLSIVCDHYDYIFSKKKDIWITTMVNVIKYIIQRNNIEIILSNVNEISFKIKKPINFKLIPLTIELPNNRYFRTDKFNSIIFIDKIEKVYLKT